jgi:preprotein translocase subunit SecG
MGAAFGGGSSQTLFGSTGASTFLSKATTVVVVVFMLTSLGLAYISSHRIGDSVMMKQEQKAPAENQLAPAAPEKSAPSKPEDSLPTKPAQ